MGVPGRSGRERPNFSFGGMGSGAPTLRRRLQTLLSDVMWLLVANLSRADVVRLVVTVIAGCTVGYLIGRP